jgi:hypothetical protein
MSWLSENVFNPIENVGSALFHGDILGGQHQASGSDWLKAGADVAGIASLGLGAGALAGGLGAADAAGIGAGAAADAGGAAAPALGFAAPEASFGSTAPDLTGVFGDVSAPTAGFTPGPADFTGGLNTGGVVPGQVGQDLAASGQNPNLFPATGGGGTAPDLTGAYGNVNSGPVNLGDVSGGGTASSLAAPNPAAAAKPGFFDSPSGWIQTAALGAAGAGLGLNLLKAGTPPPGTGPLTNVAGAGAQTFQQQAATGSQLQTYLANGTLPAPQQAQIDQMVQAQKAKIISTYAARGQSTQPGSNSALDQDLAAIDQQGLVMAANMETQLFQAGQSALQTGLNGLGISQQAYTTLANMSQAQNTQLNTAIGNFAGAAAGKGATIKLA